MGQHVTRTQLNAFKRPSDALRLLFTKQKYLPGEHSSRQGLSMGEVYPCAGKRQRLLRLLGLQEGLSLNPAEEGHLLRHTMMPFDLEHSGCLHNLAEVLPRAPPCNSVHRRSRKRGRGEPPEPAQISKGKKEAPKLPRWAQRVSSLA